MRATSDARLLLLLAPWPGEGHPSQRAAPEHAGCPMDPSRKRKLRLVVALTAAVLLATRAHLHELQRLDRGQQAVQRARAAGRQSYELTGKVVDGSVSHGGRRACASASATATARRSVPVAYTGVVPDPFREGREVIVSGELENGTFVAERDSLVTKCPSKFTKDEQLRADDGRASAPPAWSSRC